MSNRRYYVITSSGELGPHSRQELADLVREGRISAEDRLRTAFGTNAGTVAEVLSRGDDGASRTGVGRDGEIEIDGVGAAPPTPRGRPGSRASGPSRTSGPRASRRTGGVDEVPRLRLVPVTIAGGVLVVGAILWLMAGSGGGSRAAERTAPRLPAVTIECSAASWELGREGSFTLHLDRPAETELTIPLEIGGTAIPSVDVAPPPASVSIRGGATSARIHIAPLPPSAGRRPAVAVTIGVNPSAQWNIVTPFEATAALRADDRQPGDPKLTWLSSLPFADEWSWGHAPSRDRSQDGNALVIEGVMYASGFGMHAGTTGVDPTTHAAFRLDGAYDEFLCDVGIDDESREHGSAVFQVLVDGRKEFDSGMMRTVDRAKPLRVRVTGAKELRLVVLDGGNGHDWDHADWGGARLLKNP